MVMRLGAVAGGLAIPGTAKRLLFALSAMVIAGTGTGTVAAPLDVVTCRNLYAKRGELEQTGVKADMAKGPEWARDNLAKERLALIKAYIETEEQVLFRCPKADKLAKMVPAKPAKPVPLPLRRPKKAARSTGLAVSANLPMRKPKPDGAAASESGSKSAKP